MASDAKYPLWRWPEFIAGGKAIVFAGGSAAFYFGTKVSIATAPLGRAGVAKDLIAGGTSPRFAAIGDLIYAQDGTLFAVPFDSKLLATAGSSKPVIEGVRESLFGAAQFSVSATGTLVYVPGRVQGSTVTTIGVATIALAGWLLPFLEQRRIPATNESIWAGKFSEPFAGWQVVCVCQ